MGRRVSGIGEPFAAAFGSVLLVLTFVMWPMDFGCGGDLVWPPDVLAGEEFFGAPETVMLSASDSDLYVGFTGYRDEQLSTALRESAEESDLPLQLVGAAEMRWDRVQMLLRAARDAGYEDILILGPEHSLASLQEARNERGRS